MFQRAVILIKNGFSEDLAFAMPAYMQRAAIIILGQVEGGDWDWDRMRWKER